MGRLQWGRGRGDSAYVALVVGGIALALGGASLFGMVAHTWTPFLPPKGALASPFDSVARAPQAAPRAVVAPSLPSEPSAELIPAKRNVLDAIPWLRSAEPEAVEAQRPATPGPAFAAGLAPPESLSQDEFAVPSTEPAAATSAEPTPVDARVAEPQPAESKLIEAIGPEPKLAEPKAAEPKPAGPAPRAPPGETMAAQATPSEAQVAEARFIEPKSVVIRVADVRVVGAGRSKAQTELRVVESSPPETVEKTKPAQLGRTEVRLVPVKAVAVKPDSGRRTEAKADAAAKARGARTVESKRAAQVRATEAKLAEEKRLAEKKVAEAKLAEAKRVAGARRDAEARAMKVKLAEAKRAGEAKAVQMKIAEGRRAAEGKAAQAKLAEAKRAADEKVAQAKLAEAKRAAELKALEWKLAETAKLAEMKTAEAKLAESQRAYEMQAAEARLAETRRAMESTLAQAKLAEAKLAETKRAIDTTLAVARPAAVVKPVEARPAMPRYGRCEYCGTVTSVVPRYRDRGWEVRVDLGEGSDRVFIYSTDPGFSVGELVRLENGRITRLYPRRPYSPA